MATCRSSHLKTRQEYTTYGLGHQQYKTIEYHFIQRIIILTRENIQQEICSLGSNCHSLAGEEQKGGFYKRQQRTLKITALQEGSSHVHNAGQTLISYSTELIKIAPLCYAEKVGQ